MGKITLTIDNKKVEVEQGTTILKAARQVGIEIPTLCHFEMCDMGIENKPGGCLFAWWKWKDAGIWRRRA